MALAGLAAGADGLILEVHPDPDAARCDAQQTIAPAELRTIVDSGRVLHAALLVGPPRLAEGELLAVAARA
jgi:3-deoxy-7-phosphoheptulonate synthase